MRYSFLAVVVLAPLVALHSAEKARKRDRAAEQAGAPAGETTTISTAVAAKLISLPSAGDSYRRDHRTCTGVPSLAITRGGRLWVAWYSGTTPGAKIETCPNAHVVVSTSGDGGRTWQEILAIDPDTSGPLKAVDPRPWVDPQGRLWIIWHVTINGVSYRHQSKKAWATTADDGEKERPSWSQPRPVADGVMLNQPVVLANGDWLFAVHDRKTDETGLIKAVVSEDGGHSFRVRGQFEASHDLHAIEPMAVERKDGSLWMLIRTGTYPFAEHGLYESVSTDRGVTWSEPRLPAIKHTTARFHVSRLSSGNLLLVKHSGIGVNPASVGRQQRREITAFVSEDDGRTWSGGLVLDERVGCTYPDARQTADGTIHVVWDYQRSRDQEILLTTFREEDVLAATTAVADRVKANRRLVSKGGVK